jgi:uncharacterized surface protein with fasciclin (FAS1) repeats
MSDNNSGVGLSPSELLKSMENAKHLLKDVSGKFIVYPHGETWIADNNLLTNPKSHDGAVLFSEAFKGLMPAISSSGVINTGLTDEQARAFEVLMNLKPGTLSPYNKEFWSSPKRIIKVSKNGLKLDCDNNIQDKLTYLILKAHSYEFGPVAMSSVDAELNPFAQWVVKSQEKEAKNEVESHVIREKAYVRRMKMSDVEARDFLKVYQDKNGKTYKSMASNKSDLVLSTIYKIVDSDPKGFLELIDSPNFRDLVFIENLLENGLLKTVGLKVFTPEGESLGNNKYEAVQNLKTPEYQDVKISLKTRLDQIKKK